MVLDPETAATYSKKVGKEVTSLTRDKDFISTVYADLMQLANLNSFNSLGRPKQIRLLLDPFNIEDGTLTPTMKLKRNVAKILLKDQIDQMYKEPILRLSKPNQVSDKKNDWSGELTK